MKTYALLSTSSYEITLAYSYSTFEGSLLFTYDDQIQFSLATCLRHLARAISVRH